MLRKLLILNVEATMEATWKLYNIIALAFGYQYPFLGSTLHAAACAPDTHPGGFPGGKAEVCVHVSETGVTGDRCFCRTELCNHVPKNTLPNGGFALTSRNGAYIIAILSSCLYFL